MQLEQLLDSITPEVYKQLQRAVEIGRWADGRVLDDEQRSLCMQAIIAYDQRQPADQRTGYVPPVPKRSSACKSSDGESTNTENSSEQPLKWEH
jgi:uncharacterized protein YeaC (DUF1315 family)